jgi:hypothetical protein
VSLYLSRAVQIVVLDVTNDGVQKIQQRPGLCTVSCPVNKNQEQTLALPYVLQHALSVRFVLLH